MNIKCCHVIKQIDACCITFLLSFKTKMACVVDGTTSETSKTSQLNITNYVAQRKAWPTDGRHIVAQFDDDSVVVYQAYKSSIAEYAVQNQCFGGPDFSYDRMSWIKTSFLWMMYRCGWATKRGQEHVLAIRLSREGFNGILASAYSVYRQDSENLTKDDIEVRLQWDPDHDPTGEKENRRAVQLGLKQTTLKRFGTEWIKSIEDITPFVREQHKVLKTKGMWELLMPSETVYPVTKETAKKIHLDFFENTCPELVSSKESQQKIKE